jgi:hypothetical protein
MTLTILYNSLNVKDSLMLKITLFLIPAILQQRHTYSDIRNKVDIGRRVFGENLFELYYLVGSEVLDTC